MTPTKDDGVGVALISRDEPKFTDPKRVEFLFSEESEISVRVHENSAA